VGQYLSEDDQVLAQRDIGKGSTPTYNYR
jgi:hypothetical protein